jgi:hypothetical protein
MSGSQCDECGTTDVPAGGRRFGPQTSARELDEADVLWLRFVSSRLRR